MSPAGSESAENTGEALGGAPRGWRQAVVSVTAGAAACVLVSFIVLRDGVFVTVAAFGGTGGQPFTSKCPDGQVVIGVDVNSQGDLVSGFRLVCGWRAGLGRETPMPFLGDRRVTPRSLRCPVGFVGVGLFGRCGSSLERVSLSCAPGDDPLGPAVHLEAIGEGQGSDFRVRCEDGPLIGLVGRAGSRIDAVEIRCGGNHGGD